jgi:hypothetical protein
MIASLGLIPLCQLAGEVIVRGLNLPLPGPVVGLLILLLLARDRFTVFARGRGRVRRHRHEPQCAGDIAAGAVGGDAAGTLISIAVWVSPS